MRMMVITTMIIVVAVVVAVIVAVVMTIIMVMAMGALLKLKLNRPFDFKSFKHTSLITIELKYKFISLFLGENCLLVKFHNPEKPNYPDNSDDSGSPCGSAGLDQISRYVRIL